MQATNETREQILDLAQDLLQRRSIAGISFQELANQVGIKKGSMYYHFESKDSLTLALLERAREQFLQAMRKVEERPARSRLKFYCDIFGKHFGAGKKMCPGGAFAAVWEGQTETVQAAVQRVMEAHLRELEKIVAAARSERILKLQQGSNRDLAMWIASTLQGAMTVSRTLGADTPFTASVSNLQLALLGE